MLRDIGISFQHLRELIEGEWQQGIQQGEKSSKLNIAQAMLEEGYDKETIARLTGVPVEEID